MNDAAFVSVMDRERDLPNQLSGVPRRKRRNCHPLRQVHAFNKRHRDEVMSRPFADLEHGHDPWMIELRQDHRLAPKPFNVRLRRKMARQDHFKRNDASQRGVSGSVNNPHAAAGDLAEDLELANSAGRLGEPVDRIRPFLTKRSGNLAAGCVRFLLKPKRAPDHRRVVREPTMVLVSRRTFSAITPQLQLGTEQRREQFFASHARQQLQEVLDSRLHSADPIRLEFSADSVYAPQERSGGSTFRATLNVTGDIAVAARVDQSGSRKTKSVA